MRAAVETALFADDGRVPNSRLPVLIYRGAAAVDGADTAVDMERLFARNAWANGWRDGIFPFHHYHSTAHEVLGIARGEAQVRLGGEAGQDVHLRAGDIVVLPAGTGHKRLSASSDLLVIGAYPDGRDYDLVRADATDATEHARAVARIAVVPLPSSDPVAGVDGPLRRLWTAAG